MSTATKRFYADPNLGELKGLELVFPRLAEIAQSDGSNRITVYAFSKNNLDGSELATYFGWETIKSWQRSGAAAVVRFKGLTLPRIGFNDIHKSAISGPVLVLYPTPQMLEKLDQQSGVSAAGLVGWSSLDDAETWIAKWSAECLTKV